MPWTNKTIVIGFYQGIGDFLSAIPVVNELLSNGNRVVIVASRTNLELAELIAFENEHVTLIEFAPFSSKPRHAVALLRKLLKLKADYIVVSPHAQRAVSSWKLPLLLWMVKHLTRSRLQVVGSADEKMSGLYDERWPVDKQLNLAAREHQLHRLAGSLDDSELPRRSIFINLGSSSKGETAYDLVIHPGASRAIKMWPVAFHRELIERLGSSIRIALLGTPAELAPLKKAIGRRPNVEYRIGPISEAVQVVAQARVVLTMDSGFSHVAAFLGVRHFALFGSTDPTAFPPVSDNSTILYRRALSCQPCNLHVCPLKHVACMQQIVPSEVAGAINRSLETERTREPNAFTG